jgi:hypothetical protein
MNTHVTLAAFIRRHQKWLVVMQNGFALYVRST